MDVWHVQIEGSHRAQGPIARLLDRVIGQDDMVGIMTPDMSARTLTLARRTATIEGILKNHWFWGERNQINTSDPREREIETCYPDVGATAGLAAQIIARRREAKTLGAIEDLVIHLEGIREERKFVILLSEGWLLPGPDPSLSRAIQQPGGGTLVPGGPTPIGVDPRGRLAMDPQNTGSSIQSCERERSLLAYGDLRQDFLNLIQRANRSNVSFYPLDARGLVAFDEPIGPRQPPPPSVDAARLRNRQEGLRELAANTDGYAILNTNATDKALERVLQDTGAYYLLGYYSTNTKLDGRFRRLTVRVKRPGVDVRSRPGYLAPTEAELASTRVTALMNGAAPGHTTIPPSVSRALERMAPARGDVPLRVITAAAPGRIWLTGELDAATLKLAEWQNGGTARVAFEHERGAAPPVSAEISLAQGQKTFTIAPPSAAKIAPGRYVLRVELRATGGTIPLQTTTEVTVPEDAWLIAATGLALRRGPSTGLSYVATADARFRRTERLRFEIARTAGDATASARLLGRDGQPLGMTVTLGDRVEAESNQRLIVADLTLAPLAQGEYVLEVIVEQGDRKESAAYGFRIVP
jgi:VWFA-related protein